MFPLVSLCARRPTDWGCCPYDFSNEIRTTIDQYVQVLNSIVAIQDTETIEKCPMLWLEASNDAGAFLGRIVVVFCLVQRSNPVVQVYAFCRPTMDGHVILELQEVGPWQIPMCSTTSLLAVSMVTEFSKDATWSWRWQD